MNRENLIRQYEERQKKLSTKLKEVENYISIKHLLKDANRYTKLEKEIEIQKSYESHEGN